MLISFFAFFLMSSDVSQQHTPIHNEECEAKYDMCIELQCQDRSLECMAGECLQKYDECVKKHNS